MQMDARFTDYAISLRKAARAAGVRFIPRYASVGEVLNLIKAHNIVRQRVEAPSFAYREYKPQPKYLGPSRRTLAKRAAKRS